MTMPNAPRTARERARAELTREIKEAARRQLAAVGADGLSLRAVSRELGMVSSALYRYFPSRDDLLTALIIDAYDALGAATELAIAAAAPPTGRARWGAACHAIRDWARAHPHEYALIYGSPVPGYRAPEATIGPAARVPLALGGILAAALAADEVTAGEVTAGEVTAGGPTAGAVGDPGLDPGLADQAAAIAATLALPPAAGLTPQALVRTVIAWSELFGLISFELFGQFVGSFEPADALFAYAADRLASFVGFA